MTQKKVFYITIHLLLCFLAIAIVPASVYLINVPNHITPVICVLLMISLCLCFMKVVQKPMGRILLVLISVFAMVMSVLGNYSNPYWNSVYYKENVSLYSRSLDDELTKEDAIEDLGYAMKQLKKIHPACAKEIPEEVQQRYEKVLAEMNHTETISVCELNRKIESIFSVMKDGHSYVKFQTEEPHYMRDVERFRQKNCSLVALNGIELSDLLKQMEDLYSYEVESWQLMCMKNDLIKKEGLQYLGFDTDDGITYTYESKDGERIDATYDTDDFITYDEYVVYNQLEENASQETPFVYYEIDAEKDVAILTLDSCKFNQVYRDCLKNMFTEIKESGIHNVAVDLRANGGGDSRVANEFFRYLNIGTWEECTYEWRFGWFWYRSGNITIQNQKYSDLTFNGNVYILTSTNSFSSSMLFAQYVKDNKLGMIVGEAPGNTPNGYGDMTLFLLPNSRLLLQLSTKQFFRIDQDNPSRLVDPDIPCKSGDAINILYQTIAELDI